MKKYKILILFIFMLFSAKSIFAVNSVTFTTTNSLSNLQNGNTNATVGEIVISNDEAVNNFTLTISGSGFLTRVNQTGQTGDSSSYTISLVDSLSGRLDASIEAPGLPINYDLSGGDYNIVFSQNVPEITSNRLFYLKFTTPPNATLFTGSFQTDITVTLSSN